MFKKLHLSICIILFACNTYAQTIVSTSPQNQNVILEEFTGYNCGSCPEGHTVSQAIQDAYPDRVSLIYIHVGGNADPQGHDDIPDFRTPYGIPIVLQTIPGNVLGVPSATVNRHVFPGRSATGPDNTGMYRENNNWENSADETMAIVSVVNVAVEASIEVYTNLLTIHVEGFYTSDSPESTNFLNVALLQNNTVAYQSGGGENYVHMHRLVEMITGQWGEVINTTTASTFIDRTYTYTIPTYYNNVLTEIGDMEIVAFISNTRQEIPSGNRTFPSFTGLIYANDIKVRFIEDIPATCINSAAPVVNIQNLGTDPLVSLPIQYSINGESHIYNWTGNIPSLYNETIELPEITYNIQELNTVEVTVPEDDNNSNNSITTTFDKAVVSTGILNMTLTTDGKGAECRWRILDPAGTIIYSGGPYGNNQTINETFNLSADCYSFVLFDTNWDGGTIVNLTDHHGNLIYENDGVFAFMATSQFSSNGILAVNQNQLEDISLYPNPATSIINLKNAENANIQVFDVLGKMIISKDNISMNEQIDVTKLQTGTYFMKISKDNNVTTKRFLVSK